MLAIVTALGAPAAWCQPDTLRVMPLGDSITQARGGTPGSQSGFASYRYWLWQELAAAGHPVDFVGSQYGTWNGVPPYTDYDQDHEGHWGWRADMVVPEVAGWVASAQPDIVLVHLGTNDIWQRQGVDETASELAQVIDEIRVGRPDVTVFLARLIPAAFAALDSIADLNERITVLGALKDRPGSPVRVVDQSDGFDPWIHTYDGVHPNEAGEQQMAATWFTALDSVFTYLSGVAPVPIAAVGGFRFGNFPNPFNPATTFRFDLPSAGQVELAIYDAAGRHVKTLLANKMLTTGHHQVVWRGADRHGRPVGAGVYFCRLRTRGGGETLRVALIN